MEEIPQITPSQSDALSLDEVIARLAQHSAVTGILLIGSTGNTTLTPSSDYDLVVILSAMPAPMHVALTTIDGRLADVIFVTQSETDHLLELGDEVAQDSWDARLLHWSQTGRIVFDRLGRLHQIRQKAATLRRSAPSDAGDRYRTWFGINYNVTQTLRMLASDEPIYHMTVALRLLYSLSELWLGYFRVRGLPWQGEKVAIRYLSEHDRDYLERFQRCLAESELRSKVEQYVELAEHTLAPLGGLWPRNSTAIQFREDASWRPGQDKVALAFWNGILTGPGM